MSDMKVVASQSGGVATLLIQRPQRRNALDYETMELLVSNLEALAAMPAVKAIVIAGAGDYFCAGGDLSGLIGEGFLAQHRGRAGYARLLKGIEDCPKPTIAKVHGDCIGGGVGLALACDLVIAAEAARFKLPEIKLGLFPMMVMAVLLKNLPRKKALELMFTGGAIDAPQALEYGMISRVAARDELDQATEELAERIASFSGATLRLGKEAYLACQGMGRDEAMDYLHTMLTIAANTEDAVEGVSAFFAKRKPEWKEA